jgi:hypothetical protein
MRFKATVRDVRTAAAVCSTSKGFHKKCILKLAASKVRIIASANSAADGTQVWTSCRADVLFSDVQIESKTDDTIYCEVPDVGQLLFALRACERAHGVVMRLTAAGGQQRLSLAMQSATGYDANHDVPIRVMTELEIGGIAAPQLESGVLRAHLPNLADLALFVDKLRGAGCPTITFTLQVAPKPPGAAPGAEYTAGVLSLTADALSISLGITFHSVPLQQTEALTAAIPLLSATVTIDVKQFVRFLAVRDVNPSHVVAHFVHRRALVLSAYATGETNLVFYIPAVMRS